MQAGLEAFLVYQFVKDGEDLASELIDAADVLTEGAVVVGVGDPLFEGFAGDGDVAAELLGGVATEEEAVEHSGLTLDDDGIVILR